MSKLRVRHGNDEIEIDGDDGFIDKHLKKFYERVRMEAGTGPAGIKQELLEKAKPKTGKTPTPAEFYKAKGKTDGVSTVLIFGKYLEEFRGLSDFTRGDVNNVAEEAKLSKDIHAQYFTNAVKQGLLRKHGNKYSLTLSAEEVLASM